MQKKFIWILILLGIASGITYAAITQYQEEPVLEYPLPDGQNSSSVSSEISPPVASASSKSLPTSESTNSRINESTKSSTDTQTPTTNTPPSVHIAVPFASQAPLLNWDALHQEACEEASLILVNYYLNGKTITPQQMEDEIQKLVSWETDNGYNIDVTVEELKKIAKDLYGLDGRVITDVTIDSLKKELAAGNPVIIPAAGQTLGNPYFSGDGPPYHMLVVIGYDSKNFITNDVGTKRGQDYKYPYQTLINAIHDWTGDTGTITTGRKAMLVLTK